MLNAIVRLLLGGGGSHEHPQSRRLSAIQSTLTATYSPRDKENNDAHKAASILFKGDVFIATNLIAFALVGASTQCVCVAAPSHSYKTRTGSGWEEGQRYIRRSALFSSSANCDSVWPVASVRQCDNINAFEHLCDSLGIRSLWSRFFRTY